MGGLSGPRQVRKKEAIPVATLRKNDVSARVSDTLGVSAAQGEAALNAVLETVQSALAEGDRVVLTGFGTFEVRPIKARQVRPIRGGRAGSMVTVPAHNRVGFTAGSELNGSVQQ